MGSNHLTDYEHDAVKRRSPDGAMYLTADQLNRQARYHNGKDLRRKPIPLYRLAVGSYPVVLK